MPIIVNTIIPVSKPMSAKIIGRINMLDPNMVLTVVIIVLMDELDPIILDFLSLLI